MSKPKRKVRGIDRTKLVVCEGISDKKFLECVKKLTHKRDCGFSVKLDEAGGGGPKSAILHTINYFGDYDEKFVFIDSDIPVPLDAKRAAAKRKITILQSTPLCLEGLLLKMVGNNLEIFTTEQAKDVFYKMFNLPDTVTADWYDRYITEELISAIENDLRHTSNRLIVDIVKVFKNK